MTEAGTPEATRLRRVVPEATRLRRVVPEAERDSDESLSVVTLDSDEARAIVREWYRPAPTSRMRLNLVRTASGGITGDDGTSTSISTSLDRMVLGIIRSWADVVLIGAESVRREGYVVPRRAPLAVVTASGDLGGHRLEPRDDQPPIIVITATDRVGDVAAQLAGIRHTILPLHPRSDGTLDVTEVVGALHEHGFATIVCEGGPGLARQAIAAGLIDEWCVTTVPILGGAQHPIVAETPTRDIQLRQLLIDDQGVQYARWNLSSESLRA